MSTEAKPLYRELTPKVRVLSESEGLVEYVASDQTLDSYREIILADGWRFDARFTRNPVFVDSHSYWQISDVIGRVTDWRVEGGQLIEVVKWAIDVKENALAQLGFQMTAKGYLKAVSVGFIPVRCAHRHEEKEFTEAADKIPNLKQEDRDALRCIFIEQQQIELSACVLGANPSALAKAYRAGDVKEEMLARCGLADDASLEVLAIAARVFDSTEDPAMRDLARLHLRQVSGSAAFHPGRKSGFHHDPSATDDRRAAEDQIERAKAKRKAWMKQVADQLGA